MVIYQNSLSNRNLDIAKQGTVIEPLTEILDFNDVAFDVVSTATPGEVLVSFNLAALEESQFVRVDTDINYTLAVGVTYIALDTRVNFITITLPAGFEGRKIIIKDEYYNAFFRRVTLVGDATLIDFQASLQIRINGFGVQLVFTNNQWRFV